MKVSPLRFRAQADGGLLFADDTGGYFRANDAFLARYAGGALTASDLSFLQEGGHSFGVDANDPDFTAFAYRWSMRQDTQDRLSYVVLVPTLRCNLSCGYCQVSRAAESAKGYDWSAQTLGQVIRFLDTLDTTEIKVEFQGGEPLLRLDLLEAVRRFCRARFLSCQFVVCTNLQSLGPAALDFLSSDDTHVSTSLDGDPATHDRQRTQNRERAEVFFSNLDTLVERIGSERISALPTIDVENPPDLSALVDAYERIGLSSIYLRPINYQGFARRRAVLADALDRWNALHSDFIDLLVARNFQTGRVVEEYYFSHCLKRVLRAGHGNHVDLRNPSLLAADYLVVDYDGRLFPTDEARMLHRVGRVDLSIGDVRSGIDHDKVQMLNGSALNNFDPDCIHCVYQPYCGADLVDDLSRYGRIDVPRRDTWFCGRQLSLFDRIFNMIYSREEPVLFSLSRWAGASSWRAELAPDLS